MSFAVFVREHYFPVLEYAIQDIHKRLSVVNYLPAKQMNFIQDDDIADAMVDEIFTPTDNLAKPVYVECDLDNDQWVVHYKKDGLEADVYTRVIFHAEQAPVIDPIIVLQTYTGF